MSHTLNPFRGEFEVEINGKKFQGVFNLNAIRILTSELGIGLEGFDKFLTADQLTAIPLIAYYGILNHFHRSGKQFKMGRDQFTALFYDNESNLETVVECLVESLGGEEDTEGNG